MIVSLADVKAVLGISPDNTKEDVNLTRLIRAATMWVQGETHRYFDTPIPRVEYRLGTGGECLILDGHIDDSVDADNLSETLDPSFSLIIESRALPRIVPATWDTLVEGTDWERREDTIIALGGWGIWVGNTEYRLTYLDGYANAPDDIREVMFEFITNQRAMEARAVDGSAGITSERIGDFGYSVDLTQVGAGGKGVLSLTSMWTLNGYKRKLVG